MALINCTECGREVSDKAAACPGCGAPVVPPPLAAPAPPPPLPPPPRQEPMPRIKGLWLYVGLLVAVLAGATVWGVLSQPTPEQKAAAAARKAKDEAIAAEQRAQQESRRHEKFAVEFCETRYKEMNADRQYTPAMLRLHSMTCRKMRDDYRAKWGQDP